MASVRFDYHSRSAASLDVISVDWDIVNQELHSRLIQLHSDLAKDIVDVSVAGDLFSSIVSSLLCEFPYILPRKNNKGRGPHRPRATEKLLSAITTKKNTAIGKSFVQIQARF
jgi:hypothetical protein